MWAVFIIFKLHLRTSVFSDFLIALSAILLFMIWVEIQNLVKGRRTWKRAEMNETGVNGRISVGRETMSAFPG